MSIIYEALKKAQKGFPDSNGPDDPPAEKPLAQTPDKLQIVKRVLIAAIGIVGGIALSWLLMPWLTGQNKSHLMPQSTVRLPKAADSGISVDPEKNVPSTSAPKTNNIQQPIVKQRSETAQKQFPELILNGIIVSDAGNSALINNLIMNVGDKIEDAEVTAIEKDSVLILFQGEEIILRNK